MVVLDYPQRTLIIKATVGLLIFGFLVYLLWRALHKGSLSYKYTELNEQYNQETGVTNALHHSYSSCEHIIVC